MSSSSVQRGVRQRSWKKWVAEIGTFPPAIDADLAHDDAARPMYGATAGLNLPNHSSLSSSKKPPVHSEIGLRGWVMKMNGGMFVERGEGEEILRLNDDMFSSSEYDSMAADDVLELDEIDEAIMAEGPEAGAGYKGAAIDALISKMVDDLQLEMPTLPGDQDGSNLIENPQKLEDLLYEIESNLAGDGDFYLCLSDLA